MARKPETGPARQRFAALMREHLANGTHPSGVAGEPWKYSEFAKIVASSNRRSEDGNIKERSPSNWCSGHSLPHEIEPVLGALFGRNEKHTAAREALRQAYIDAKWERSAASVKRAKPDPAGLRWIPQGDQFVIDHSFKQSDRRAAADPIRRQLQAAIRNNADELTERSGRLHNDSVWKSVPDTAREFGIVVRLPPEAFLGRLGDAYALLLRLGRFLDTDRRINSDRSQMHEPLPPDVHGLLSDLVRLAAPWLRGFPTVATMDDAAGKTLVRLDLMPPALEFVEIVRREEAISIADARTLADLASISEGADFLSQKAGARAIGSVKNLLVSAAVIVAAEPNERKLLVERVTAALAASLPQVVEISVAFPADLAEAICATANRAKHPAPFEIDDSLTIPVNVERRVAEMIQRGAAPPKAWRQHVRWLSIDGQIENLDLFEGLINLKSIDAYGFNIKDLSPLSDLVNLERLRLTRTSIKTIKPIVGLKKLRYLDLSWSRDLEQLDGIDQLFELEELYLAYSGVESLWGVDKLARLKVIDLRGVHLGYWGLGRLEGRSGLQVLR